MDEIPCSYCSEPPETDLSPRQALLMQHLPLSEKTPSPYAQQQRPLQNHTEPPTGTTNQQNPSRPTQYGDYSYKSLQSRATDTCSRQSNYPKNDPRPAQCFLVCLNHPCHS